MRVRRLSSLAVFLCFTCLGQTPSVGSGAPNDTIAQRFYQAYIRNGFNLLVALPPVGNVQRFGTTGLIQLFQDAAKTGGVRLALIKATTSTVLPPTDSGSAGIDVFQVLASMYSYYSSVGVATAGYPITDTLGCPALAGNSCQYQFFDRNYVLFVYTDSILDGPNFALRDPFFTKWTSLGGIAVLGPVASLEQNLTSKFGTTAKAQIYQQGAIYSITSGTSNGRLLGVLEPIYDLYASYGGAGDFLGFPTSEELVLASGRWRQTFEGGAIEYDPGSGPVLRRPVTTVSVAPSTLRLNLGDSATLTATVLVTDGAQVVDRAVTWTTSNGRVVTVQSSGVTATVRAVGGGSAVITATSEGKSSSPITVYVSAPCCQVGEGAPTASIQQAFQDAVTRNRLSLQLPAPSPVRRVGNGYVQEFQGADPASTARYLLAKPDRFPAAYVVTGEILKRYEELGGPAGSLGYPASDPTPGGRQLFENDSALAGAPVRVVSGAILAKWAVLGYEAGAAGPPSEEASAFLTFTGTGGNMQPFRDGAILAGQTGPQAGHTFLVRGLILARYAALGMAGGSLGMPANEEFGAEGRRRQDFEGGYIDYAAGDKEAAVHQNERRPTVGAAPNVVIAGSRVRLTVSGFDAGAKLSVSITGQPDFEVTVLTGAYSWEAFVPATAASGTVQVRAVDAGSSKSAEGSYQIKAAAEAGLQLKKLKGDAQIAPPGALAPQPLRVSLRDDRGNPVAGVSVRFAASPGAQIAPASALTDQNGEAEAALRLPSSEGIALATAEASRLVVTFSAQAARVALTNFPKFTQTGDAPLGKGPGTIAQKGALLVAAASILRYHQNRGELAAPYGLADPTALNQYLSTHCVFDPQGAQICDGFLTAQSGEPIVNLWRLADFAGGSLTVSAEKADPRAIRDLLGQGTPVLVGLSLTSGGPAGSHFVVASGVGADGDIQIQDPSPTFARANLSEYTSGFVSGSRTWKGTLVSALRLLPLAPSPTGFLVSGDAGVEIASPAGSCDPALVWPDTAAPVDSAAKLPGVFRARYCDGLQPNYQLEVSSAAVYQLLVTDLATGGSRFEVSGAGAAAYKLTRPAALLTVAPQDVSFTAGSVVNAASFSTRISPGALISIFGAGLARQGSDTVVEIDGTPVPVISASPFQVNAQVPLEVSVGTHKLAVRSFYGRAEQSVEVRETAPAIFLLEAGRGAVVNQDGKLNAASSPATRGQAMIVYGTGFGSVTPQGGLSWTRQPVSALLQGLELPAAFAGLTPGFIGLYQINLLLPSSLPPGLDLPLTLKQVGVTSNSVPVAVQ